jgi:hypothetical protein
VRWRTSAHLAHDGSWDNLRAICVTSARRPTPAPLSST